jgi:hypothetical protein
MGGANVARHVGVPRMQLLAGRIARLERRIPVGAVDIRRSHLDAVLLHVAHDLGRRIKAHRLAV